MMETAQKENVSNNQGESPCSLGQSVGPCSCGCVHTYLKPLVLENFLDCDHLLAVDEASLVDHSKGAISYNLYVCVGHFLWTIGALARRGHHCCHFATISCY